MNLPLNLNSCMCPVATLLESTGKHRTGNATYSHKSPLTPCHTQPRKYLFSNGSWMHKIISHFGKPTWLESAPCQALYKVFRLLDSKSKPSKNRQVEPRSLCGYLGLCLWWALSTDLQYWNSLCWLRQVEEDVTEKQMWQFKSSPFKCIYI